MNIQSNLKNVQNILDRFPKEKTELTTHEVNLGEIQNEINKVVNTIKSSKKEFEMIAQEVEGAGIDYDTLKQEIETAKKKLKDAKETAAAKLEVLGVRTNKALIKELSIKIKKMASELGVKPEDVKGYKSLLFNGKENDKNIQELKNIIKSYNV